MKSPKDKLQKTIEIAIRSSFIRALAEMEKEFGHLWGEFIDDENKLSPEQQLNDEKYDKMRKRILDFGNYQIRMIDHCLKFYNIEHAHPTVVFLPKDKIDGNQNNPN